MGRIAIDRIHVKNGGNRRKNRSLQPRRRLAVRAQNCFHVHRSDGVVIVELNVVLSGPDHLHRPAHFLGQNRSLRNVIGLRLAPESPAEQCYMANYIFLRDAQLFRDDVLHGLRILRRGPQCRFAVFEFREGNQWLHRSVR